MDYFLSVILEKIKSYVCYHSNTEARDKARHEVTFSLNQLEDKESMLDFSLHQSDTKQQFEGDYFEGFRTEQCEREGEYCA